MSWPSADRRRDPKKPGTPVIGVCTVSEEATWGFWTQQAAIVPFTYVSKIRAAGGIATGLIPDDDAAVCPDLLDRVDGLLLIGGVDVDPDTYGAPRSHRTEATDVRRDSFEIALTRAALRRDVPVLGICRGMQVLNVATGGTLHHHLTDSGFQQHRPQPGRLDSSTFHEVEVEANSHAAALAGPRRQMVNSHHHQGVETIGAGARVTARSVPDGLAEAIEWPDHRYVLGVQWHPEAPDLQHAFNDLVTASAAASRSTR
jgi:putative glutamine amidotransferase